MVAKAPINTKDEQPQLPGIPAPPAPVIKDMYRVNYQYQGPNYALRQGSLMIPATSTDDARNIGAGTLSNTLGDKWWKINSIIKQNDEVPF